MFLRQLLRFLPSGFYAEGLRAYNDGDYATAQRALRLYLAQPAGRFRQKAEFHLCEVCIQAGEKALDSDHPQEAASLFQEALALHPEYADVHNRLGEALMQAGQCGEAVAAFAAALERNPRFYAARLNLVRVRLTQGETDAAVAALVAFQQHCPPLMRERAADLVRRCREGDLAAMRAAVEAFRSEQPDELALKKAQALDAIQRRDNGLAISLLAGLLERHGQYADLHHLMGLAYGNAGMLDDAALEFRQALRLNPDFVKARVNLGISLLESGHYREAEAELKLAEEIEPCNPLVLNALAELAALTEA